MRRIVFACTASLVLYIAAFAWLLDRPLTLGALQARIDANLAAAQTISQPKLVILAGSNGPYSHRCETIAPAIGRPCINAGVAVGIGLDYLFTRWKPWLHGGDLVYLPLEEAQYVRQRAASELGPDAAIMLRHDHATWLAMPLRRRLAALFAGDLRAAIMSLIETALTTEGFHDPRVAVAGGYNVWGDHIGHTALLGAPNQPVLATVSPTHPNAAEITAGYGTRLVTDFLHWASAHNIRVIGGLPTGFIDSPIEPAALDAIHAVYHGNGADFLDTPEHGRYPRCDFFDTQDHLNEAAQIRHSIAVAKTMARFIALPSIASLHPDEDAATH